MFSFFRRENALYAISSIIFGFILVSYPSHTLRMMVSIIAWGALITGAGALIGFITGWRNTPTLLTAVAGLVLGVWMMSKPVFFASIIPFIVGAVIFLNACFSVYTSIKNAKQHSQNWKQGLVLAVSAAILGLVIMMNPFSSVRTVVMVAGIGLIYSGIMRLLVGSLL